MKANETLIETLNDLIRINNDRINGYEKAVDETREQDMDLRGIFAKMANDSRDHVRELSNAVVKMGGEPATDSTISGKIYRTWMDVKAAFASKERLSVLEACEYGEDAAQKAYDSALKSDAEMSAETRQLIMDQKSSLKNAHDLIKKYRDMHETVAS
ncbi:ferritin-like domain-containing protein [Sediminibacterium soli]|uniref:ferritin-like domain-containing protein n=1 Tax=Sediminibacterium soli TaxID=2698829 RepID=UPI00137B3B4C|nr:PA2169 family four-helix-bundle protein [Sediminibacterium soli]NCI45903.1 PA2169 family four-helix-bundle protein [Sediminibacterium soli]